MMLIRAVLLLTLAGAACATAKETESIAEGVLEALDVVDAKINIKSQLHQALSDDEQEKLANLGPALSSVPSDDDLPRKCAAQRLEIESACRVEREKAEEKCLTTESAEACKAKHEAEEQMCLAMKEKDAPDCDPAKVMCGCPKCKSAGKCLCNKEGGCGGEAKLEDKGKSGCGCGKQKVPEHHKKPCGCGKHMQDEAEDDAAVKKGDVEASARAMSGGKKYDKHAKQADEVNVEEISPPKPSDKKSKEDDNRKRDGIKASEEAAPTKCKRDTKDAASARNVADQTKGKNDKKKSKSGSKDQVNDDVVDDKKAKDKKVKGEKAANKAKPESEAKSKGAKDGKLAEEKRSKPAETTKTKSTRAQQAGEKGDTKTDKSKGKANKKPKEADQAVKGDRKAGDNGKVTSKKKDKNKKSKDEL